MTLLKISARLNFQNFLEYRGSTEESPNIDSNYLLESDKIMRNFLFIELIILKYCENSKYDEIA